jgi:hypothetical protein
MKSCRNLFFCVTPVFIFFLPVTLFAQDPPIQWGEVPKADLEMKTFPDDSNASAIILCDYGESSFNNSLHIIFDRTVRIKILTTKGYKHGTFCIPIYSFEDKEEIRNIEGVTYSLDDRGEIEKKELNKDDIIKEEVENEQTQYKFSLPGLKPGCVVEVRYEIESNSPYLMHGWVFQHSEPVRWSEYRIRTPVSIAYSTVFLGYEPYAVQEILEVNQMFSGLRTVLGSDYVRCRLHRCAVQNLPALRDEPFITTIDDYVNKVDVQLAGYAFVLRAVEHTMNTWTSLVNELVEYKDFLERVDDTRRLRKKAEEITSGWSTPIEKMKALYAWVSNCVVWTGLDCKYSERDVDDVLESKKGSSADIAFLFLSLLKSAGIEGDPVILSTRDNGKIQVIYPIESQFNYVLARVTIGSNYYYLDPTDPLRPAELLPTKVLNTRGLVIKKDSVIWVPLTTKESYSNMSFAAMNLQADGSVRGTFEDAYRKYAGAFIRRSLRNKKEIDIAREQFDADEAGIAIDSVRVEGMDSIDTALKLKAWISSPGYAQSNGDLIYINPHILHRNKENPFKTKIRKFPIDYAYQRSTTSVTSITIPDSFEVKSMPADRSLRVGPNLLLYSRKMQVDSRQVQLMKRLEIRETEIDPKYYAQLKNFYAQMVDAESEQLVLERAGKTPIQNKSDAADLKKSRKRGNK